MPAPDDRLLYVVNDTGFFVSHRLPLALSAQQAGFEVHLAALDAGHVETVRDHGIHYHALRLNRTGTNPLQELDLMAQTWRVVRKVRPRLMHTVTIKPVIYGGLAARALGVPALVSAISGLGFMFGEASGRKRMMQKAVGALYRVALGHDNGRVIFQNPDDREQFVSADLVAADRTVLIRGSGVDLSIFHPAPEPPPPPVVLLPARLLWEKGIAEFAEAARIVRSSGVDGRFVLVGDLVAHNRASVPRATIEQWQAEGVLEWWGYRADMPEVYAGSHIVCLPSYYREGVPKALIEAAACGRAMVTTDMPGCREVVRHGENGLLVPPRSSEALAAAILVLLRNPEQRHAMGRRGREIASAEFSIERVVEETLAIYETLVPRPRAADAPDLVPAESVRRSVAGR